MESDRHIQLTRQHCVVAVSIVAIL